MASMTYQELGKTGLQVSTMSFGAGPLGNVYDSVSEADGIKAVHYAIERGINFFDTSPYYGGTLSEERLGRALVSKRDKVILATKGGRYGMALETGFDFTATRLIQSVEESLNRLQTDYLDVYHLHDIEFWDIERIIDEAVPALQKIKQQGKARFVGVTGYPLHILKRVAEATDIDAVLSYCHYNLLNTRLEDVLIPLKQKTSIGLINASTLHMGVLTEKGAQDWHPTPKKIYPYVDKAIDHARNKGSDITTLALQFGLQNSDIDTTLVGMRTIAEVEHNLKVFEADADTAFIAEIRDILAPVANIAWQEGRPENYEPDALPKQS